jgi:hypothetical protein
MYADLVSRRPQAVAILRSLAEMTHISLNGMLYNQLKDKIVDAAAPASPPSSDGK